MNKRSVLNRIVGVTAAILLIASSLLCSCDISWIDDLIKPAHIYPDESQSGVVATEASVDYWGEITTFEIQADASIYWGAQSYESRNFVGDDYWAAMTMDSALDDFYMDLLAKFEPIRKKYALDEDQFVALLTIYVQDIPYDDHAEVIPRYPVVTAIDNLGDCDEKSMLLVGLLAHAGYDVALIDCPPSLGLLTVNALAAADRLLVPLQCEYYAMQGLSLLAHTVQMVRESGVNSDAQIDAILLTMYSANLRLTREIEAQIREVFGSRVLKTVIPRNVDLAAAPGQGLSIRDWAKRSRGGEAYHELALEVKKLWL